VPFDQASDTQQSVADYIESDPAVRSVRSPEEIAAALEEFG
jgi:hypothetical protein